MSTVNPGTLLRRLLNGISRRWKSGPLTERERLLRCRKDSELAVCLMEEGSVDPMAEQPRVVIVGAGMAGLSAASRLLQCGIDNFVILEATDRPGGRLHTCSMGNMVCELGPAKIYGASPMNPLQTLAAREGLHTVEADRSNIPICLTSGGRPVPELVNATAHFSLSLIKKQAAALKGKLEAKGLSLWDFVATRIVQEVELYPPGMRVLAARRMFGLTNDLRNFLGTDLSNVALNQYGTKLGSTYGPELYVPTGMVGLLAPLIRPLPTCDHILYCKDVKEIAWSDALTDKPGRVKVVCCDATVYKADYVIVTFPLGVLKDKASTMFIPSLPESKLNAIKNMGFDNQCRINLEYEKPFWVWKSGSMLFGWSLAELKTRKSSPSWVKGIGTVEETPGTQQGLQLAVSGMEADLAEGLSDVRIAEDFTRAVRTFTGDSTLPYPANVLKSCWRSSKYFKGAVPFFTVESSLDDLCAIRSPVPDETKSVPAVMFAGDCTSTIAMGTLAGARQSGVREADRVIKLTRQLAGRPRPEAVEAEACKCKPRTVAAN